MARSSRPWRRSAPGQDQEAAGVSLIRDPDAMELLVKAREGPAAGRAKRRSSLSHAARRHSRNHHGKRREGTLAARPAMAATAAQDSVFVQHHHRCKRQGL
ncbi:hypothetical protein ACQJBY_038251 [Aegilops geniculata]